MKISKNLAYLLLFLPLTLFTQCGSTGSETGGEEVYADYTGRYKYPNGLVLIVSEKDKALYARLSDQPEFEISPDGKDVFKWSVIDSKVEFHRDAENKVDSVTHYQGDLVLKGSKIADRKIVKLTEAQLDKNTGTYVGPDGTMNAIRDGEKFYLQLAGRPRFEAFPTAEDAYFLQVVDATVAFRDNQDGKRVMVFTQNAIDREFIRE